MNALKRTKRRRLLAVALGLYLLAWLVTALFGPAAVTRRFDSDHAFGFRGLSDERVPSTRVLHLDVRDPFSSSQQLPEYPWHYISSPRAVCPFVLVSDFGYVFASLGGGGGRLWTFWFFGWQVEIHSQFYWHV